MNALVLALVLAQGPRPVPPPPDVPVIVDNTPKVLSYAKAYELAKKSDKPIVLYVGAKPHDHPWAVVAYEKTFTRYDGKVETDAILITRNGRGQWLRRAMSEREMQDVVDSLMAETEVRRAVSPVPFLRAAASAPVRSSRSSANC